jgi:hypothetical protein
VPVLLFGQQDFTITGKILDKDTKEPLPYATVVYESKSTGTVSDHDGCFTLSIFGANESDSILISYMGYQPLRLSISKCLQSKTHELQEDKFQLNEVVVRSKKFNLKSFVKEIITNYNKNRRNTPHIAIAHYREKAKENNKYVMYMESIGYSVFAGNLAKAAPLSNYKFFCENTRCHVSNPQWVKYKENTFGFDIKTVSPSGSSNLNIFRYLEISGLLSKKHYNKYKFEIDSSYYIGNTPVYCIKFNGNVARGKMHVFPDSKKILKIECTTDRYWSNAFHKRLKAQVSIRFNYFDNTPFVSSILASYKNKELEYQNYLEILVQKFNDFALSESQYWSINDYDSNPYIHYNSEEWLQFDIKKEEEYEKIAIDLSINLTGLDKHFENHSGQWVFLDKHQKENELAKATIKQLIQNF